MLRPVLYTCLALAVVLIAVPAVRLSQEKARVADAEGRLVASRGFGTPVHKRLSSEYTDSRNRLLADPPSDPSKLLDPDTLVVAHDVDTESEVSPVDWEGLQSHLAKATGRRIVVQEYLNTADDVAAVKSSKVHVVALHAADTPHLVNYAGFIPFAVLGTEAGANGNRLDLVVPAKSQVHSLVDLRGHTLTCTRPNSITGYRAAIAVLLQETGMRPYVDYSITWSFGQSESIHALAAGKLEAAALSDDKLQIMLKKEQLKESEFRRIFQSQVIPHLTIGHVYNLKPSLADELTSAIFSFDNANGAPDESSGQPMRFVATDYKKDFEFVRRIDDAFDPRFGERSKVKPAPEPVQVLPDTAAN